jgi:hypothetical protein
VYKVWGYATAGVRPAGIFERSILQPSRTLVLEFSAEFDDTQISFIMASESKNIESEPFLQYSDDPTSNQAEPDARYAPARGRGAVFLTHFAVFALTSLLWLTAHSFLTSASSYRASSSGVAGHRHNVTSHAKLITCGTSIEEAQSIGCKYDVLLNTWVPPQCADNEFVNEYLDDGSWDAFADRNMTQKLTPEEMSRTKYYYTSVRDHINHCAVMWKKQFWSLYEERQALDTIIASPGHTDHCAQYLIDVTADDWTQPTQVEMGFGGCWIKQ